MLGPEAAAFTEAQLPVGSTVYLVADEEDTDRYGRSLRYVWTEDGTFFNVEAARQGTAWAVLYEPNDRHIEDVRAAEAEAKKADRGMWARRATTTPHLHHLHHPRHRPTLSRTLRLRPSRGLLIRTAQRRVRQAAPRCTGASRATGRTWTGTATGSAANSAKARGGSGDCRSCH